MPLRVGGPPTSCFTAGSDSSLPPVSSRKSSLDGLSICRRTTASARSSCSIGMPSTSSAPPVSTEMRSLVCVCARGIKRDEQRWGEP